MSLATTLTELSDSRVRLDAEVPGEEVEARVKRTAAELGREMKLPGFRKGKVPGDLVIKRVGREAILEQTIRETLPEWYEEAVLRSGVSTVGDPKLDLSQMPASGEPLRFSIQIAVTPKAKLGKYKGLEVGKREPHVPQEAIDKEIEHLRTHAARLDSVDRAAKEGDFLVVDFVGKVDGEPFEGGEARGYMLELGADQLVEGFEQQLVGTKAGEQRHVEVDFPDDYRAEDLRGKHAVFDVEITDVKERELPDLDDELAMEVSEFETLAELRADVEAKLRAAQERTIEDEFRGAAIDAAVAQARVDLPDELVAARAEETWERTARALKRQGIDPESYLKASGKAKEQLVQEAKPDAAAGLARESVLSAIADAERIEVSDEELLGVLTDAAKASSSEPRRVLDRLLATGRDAPIRRDLQLRKAVDVVVEAAKPIPIEKAKAREAIWTPEKEEDSGGPGRLWTPGAGDPVAGGKQS